MIDGDLTLIGEKGSTLSGGQKLRVSLARALYADRQFIIFDDPLSALDAHVGKFIFKETICQFLKGKTIILITHSLDLAKDFDYIYMLNDGEIYEHGTYEFIKQNELFRKMKFSHSTCKKIETD